MAGESRSHLCVKVPQLLPLLTSVFASLRFSFSICKMALIVAFPEMLEGGLKVIHRKCYLAWTLAQSQRVMNVPCREP